MRKNLLLKFKEAFSSVAPIAVIVILLHFTITPMSLPLLGLFIVSSLLLILGMGLFTLGADVAMTPMGEFIGSQVVKSRKLVFLVVICFLIGFMITIAEPDLQVLAKQVSAIPNMTLIVTVSVGVGIFLVIAVLRILFQIRLSILLIIFYIIVFVLAAFSSQDFIAVAFDSGGVTTGPMTVPFILALGVGIASVRGDKSSEDDSFGLVALCSIGPILAVMVLGMIFNSDAADTSQSIIELGSLSEIGHLYLEAFPEYFKEVFIALAPIIVFFFIFQAIFIKLPKIQLIKISVGLIYTYLGLVVFLTAVNTGFLPIGRYVGEMLGNLSYNWIAVPVGMVIGFFVVAAEPAVHVLNNQVEDVSGGAISKSSMLMSLSIGVAIALGIAMIRALTGVSIWYFMGGGYLIALILTFFVPKVFTAIAFDSGGVASGPMTATFILPLVMGVCQAIGGNVLQDAFGTVAMVAMTPLITIQILGLIYSIKTKKSTAKESELELEATLAEDDSEIIDL